MPERSHLQHVIESAIDFAIVVTDLDGIVTDWNAGAENIFGWRSGEILGASSDCIFTARDRAAGRPSEERRVALAEGRAADERWHVRKDGSEFWASGELMPLRREDGTRHGYVKILRDRTGPREAGERLRKTEDLFRTLLDTVETAFAIVEVKFDGDRPVNYRFLEANPAFERQAGVNLRGKWVTEFAPDLERFWFETYGRVAWTGEPANFESYANNFERWFDVRAIRVGEPADRHIAIFFNDVTARKVAEAELRTLNDTLEQQVQERTLELNTLWDTSPDLLLVIDFAGVFRRVNPAWTKMLGYTPEELLGRHVNAFVVPDDHAETIDAYTAAAEGAQPRIVNRYRHKDGSLRWISWVAVPAGDMLYATGRDVTAEKERDALLRDAQDFARLALSAVGGVGVWTYELDSDRFFYDAAIAKLYAIDPERGSEGIPRPDFLANVHPDDRPALKTTMAGGLANAGDLELEYRLCHPDGTVHWVLSRGHTYHDAAGRPLRRTGVGIDTTSQRQTEEALRQSQKMEAVGQLTGGLAHDFNNLLAGISGALELMQTRISQGRFAELDRYMTVAQGAAKRAAALTHRLLAFSRRQTLTPKPTNVNQLILGMEELIRRTIGPEVGLDVIGAPALWPALIDPGQLENALLNLCINARDAMPAGGRITIETANTHLDRAAALRHDLPEGPYLVLRVTDTGTGMPPEVIARVFEPFFTTKPIGQGTGLGLSMIHGFAQQSGGQVQIESEVGRGTTVCLYMPRHRGEAEGGDVALQLSGVARAGRDETVLIVDDEPSVRMLVTEVLEDLGYTAIEAADSTAGLKVLQSDVHIDLLVTDVGLPGGMNGRQMADAGRERRPDLKVLFITGYAETAVLGHGHLEPGMQVLTKPFPMDALAARIKDLIAAR
ncbi:PAS domain S-box protein [Methylobacterium sp. WL7]|uniref:hybrid sensor histidine kinase/response regulator n=1 Tax=Methylobacterium sp. WL7 TaxID=2603900 RepID=UPI0011C848CD|nr:PAS domain S-box protein [Methylobacterium sp. WL7]TXN47761.1 PAS domain S-box protein [Methylobacterium sp. WL7]